MVQNPFFLNVDHQKYASPVSNGIYCIRDAYLYRTIEQVLEMFTSYRERLVLWTFEEEG